MCKITFRFGATALACLALMQSVAYAGSVGTYDKVVTLSNIQQAVVSNYRYDANSPFELVLKAPTATLVTSGHGHSDSANVVFLDEGGVITGWHGAMKLGRGDVWLPDLSWAGLPGESVSIESTDSKGTDAKSTSTSYSCSVRNTVLKTQYGVTTDLNFITVTFELTSGVRVTMSCRTGSLRTFILEP